MRRRRRYPSYSEIRTQSTNNKWQTYRFESIEAFVSKASEPESEPALGRASRDNGNSFRGGSWDNAIKLASQGWPEGSEQIRAIASKISVPDLSEAITQTYHDTSGSYVDVDRFLSGEPECMIEFQPDMRTKKTVKLAFEACYSAGEAHESINNRGATIGALVDILESKGIRCEVVATVHTSAWKTGGDGLKLEIVLKTPEQPLDLDRIAFACAHPSFLRRLVFAWEETLPHKIRQSIGAYTGGGYGEVWSGTPEGFDIYIGTRTLAHWTPESAVQFIHDSLATVTKGN